MPGPGGNRGGKKKMVKASPTGRYKEAYGPMIPPGKDENPGIGTIGYRRKVTDAIRGWGSHNSKTRYGS